MAAIVVEAAAADFLTSLLRPSHILVAISGGSDSTGMLVALADQIGAGPHSHTLSAVTIDHALRPESAGEARSVNVFCGRLGIVHHTRRWSGDKPKSGLMAAAREARYALLAEVASEVGADLIVTGHTLDDQRETLAMRGARAPESQGTATGIADTVLFDRRIWVARPFLGCLRVDIRALLVARGLSWIDDPSNADPHYERVRVRARFAEGEGGALPTDGGETKSALSAAAALWLAESVTIHAGLLCHIDANGIDVASPAFAYGLSHLTAVFGGQPFGLGQEKMQRIMAFLEEGRPGRRTAGGVVFDRRRDGLYLMRESRNIAALQLAPGASGVWDGRFDVANGSRRAVQIVAAAGAPSSSLPDRLPKGAAIRTAASAPHVYFEGGGGPENDMPVTITPRLAPFDRFLTRFDLSFASQLSMSFGRTAYLSPPL